MASLAGADPFLFNPFISIRNKRRDISSGVTLPVRYILGSYVTREIYPQQLRYPCDISSAGYVPHPFGYNSPQPIIVSVWRTKFKFAGSGVVAR
jgi:hypothetical protein